jgi:hypothetical protein
MESAAGRRELTTGLATSAFQSSLDMRGASYPSQTGVVTGAARDYPRFLPSRGLDSLFGLGGTTPAA